METTKKEMKAYLLQLQLLQRRTFGTRVHMTVMNGDISTGELTLTASLHVFDEPHNEIIHSLHSDIDEWRSMEENNYAIRGISDFIKTYGKKL